MEKFGSDIKKNSSGMNNHIDKYNGLIIGVALIVSSVIIYSGLIESENKNRYEVFASNDSIDSVGVAMLDKKLGIITSCFHHKYDETVGDRCPYYFEGYEKRQLRKAKRGE